MTEATAHDGHPQDSLPWWDASLRLAISLMSTAMVYLVQVGCVMTVGWFHYWLYGDRDSWLHVAMIDHAFVFTLVLFAAGAAIVAVGSAFGLLKVTPARRIEERPDAATLHRQAEHAAQGDRPDLARAYDLLVESHAAGSPKAAYALANWHMHGIVVPRDRTKAVALLGEAADAGIPAALHDLGSAHESGTGTVVDHAKAYQSYLRSALLGHVEALRAVSRCLDTGRGVHRDQDAAQTWWDVYLTKGGIPGNAATGAWPWSSTPPSPV